jgi:hypothetical protein
MIALIFLAGPLRRLAWRQFLPTLAFATCAFAICMWLVEVPYQWDMFWKTAAIVALAGVNEWIFHPNRSRKSLVWLIALGAAVAMLVPLILKPLELADYQISLDIAWPRQQYVRLADVAYWPLTVVLLWTAVPTALTLPARRRRWPRIIAAASASLCIAGFFLFFDYGAYRLADRSVLGDGPFARMRSLNFLLARGNDSDWRAVWNTLRATDWSPPEAPTDFRRACFNAVSLHDRAQAANRLSAMLRAKPRLVLARMCAPLMAARHLYETVPCLMRYALLGDDECLNTLEQMRVAGAAAAIDFQISLNQVVYGPVGGPIPSELRVQLTHIFGTDAGPRLVDWYPWFAKIRSMPGPLSREQLAENNRVIAAYGRYLVAFDQLFEARTRLYILRMKQAGMDFEGKNSLAEPLAYRHSSALAWAGLSRPKLNTLNRIYRSVYADLDVKPPNWDIPGTDNLEKSVDEYVAQVNAAIAAHPLATTAPSAPATSRPARSANPAAPPRTAPK